MCAENMIEVILSNLHRIKVCLLYTGSLHGIGEPTTLGYQGQGWYGFAFWGDIVSICTLSSLDHLYLTKLKKKRDE
jgi:hypothetical protein